MSPYEYQYGFSTKHSKSMYDIEKRKWKAKKTISVLRVYFEDENLETLSLLDIGCSTGIMTTLYGEVFGKVMGIDIDKPAVDFAIRNNASSRVDYAIRDAMATGFDDESFDIVTCTHIYEHVPDSRVLMAEIHRLLRKGGVCYFAAGNRFHFMEAHYHLPLLSVIPKPLSHIYLRVFRKIPHYYENHLTLWGLRKLVSQFKVYDFTKKIIKEPEKYCATEMVSHGTFLQQAALSVMRIAYWLCPTYIWVLEK